MWEKIKAFFTGPRLIEEFRAIEQKIEKEITPEIEKIAVEIKNEVIAEVKKRGRKKKK